MEEVRRRSTGPNVAWAATGAAIDGDNVHGNDGLHAATNRTLSSVPKVRKLLHLSQLFEPR